MPENEPTARIFTFGEFTLMADDRMVMRGKHRVHMTPRVFHLLLKLVENAGRVVTKETLLNEIWQDSFVEEGNLNSTVSRLRKILGEKPDENRYIETIPRVGYRFVAEVEIEERASEFGKPAVGEPPTTETRRDSKRWLIAPVAVIAAAAVLLAGWLWMHRPSPAAGKKKEKNVLTRVVDDSSDDGRPSWTLDGQIRFHRREGKRIFSFIMNGDGSDLRRDTSIKGLASGVWSRDEKKVVYDREDDESGSLYLANADGSNEIKLPFPVGNMDWSPDGSKIVYQYGHGNVDIYLYTLATGKSEVIVNDSSFDADPSFSPDGKKIAFVSGRDGNQEIYVEDIDGTNLRRLTNHPARDAFPTFSPDGTQISFNSNREGENLDVYVMNADGSNVRRLTDWSSDEESFPGSWSQDGTQLFVVSGRSGKDNIYIMNVEPFPTREIIAEASSDLRSPNYSHDGRKILFQSLAVDNMAELRILDADTGRITTVAKTQTPDAYPRLSPDGNWVAFQDRINDNGEICLIHSDGSGGVQDLTNDAARDVGASWSSDGSKLVFTSNRDGNYDLFQIYVMNSDGSNQHRVYQSSGMSADPNWSPDSSRIVFANDKEDNRAGNFEIFSIEPETTEAEKRLTFRQRYDISPAYSPDGDRIAFASNTDGNWEIYMMNSDGSGLIRLTRDIADDGEPSWSPDGTRIIFVSNRSGRPAICEVSVD
jgi:Tol biopolymer transport system component/DNA-binding winged helix-turn-helix (wHTH) protein